MNIVTKAKIIGNKFLPLSGKGTEGFQVLSINSILFYFITHWKPMCHTGGQIRTLKTDTKFVNTPIVYLLIYK